MDDGTMGDQYTVEPVTSVTGLEKGIFGGQLMRSAAISDGQRRKLWYEMITEWVEFKASRSNSPHTRRNYQAAMERWQTFLATQHVGDGLRPVELWEVDHTHVRAWQAALRDTVSESTVNHQLSCVSSFYSFVINEKRIVAGVEIDLFVDALGRSRQNPFKVGNIRRGHTEDYERARPLTLQEYDQLLTYLEGHRDTLAGARNYALILTYLHTGWRSSELLRMQWKDVRPSRSQPGTYVFAWKGKGGKAQDDVLPSECYFAIVEFLKAAGRWTPGAPGREEGLAPEEHVWLPIADSDMRGMKGSPSVDWARPICDKSALRTLRSSLRKAGIPHANRFRIHDLRHTHAFLLLQSGQGVHVVRDRLHHSSLATTGVYAKAIHRSDPLDTHTAQFRQLRKTV